MKNKLIFLAFIFAGLIGSQSIQAYWVDENGYRHHDGVVRGSAYAADNIVSGTGYAIGDLFGAHHYRYVPSDHYCRHHQLDPACN